MAKCKALLFLLVIALFAFGTSSSAYAASSANFSSADSAISAAYVATFKAEQNGGNVSSLVIQLNAALNLVQRAHGENSSQSALDLENATRIANIVLSESSQVAQRGVSSVRTRTDESIGGAAAVLIVGALIYIFAGRIYRRGWFYAHRNYVVKPADG